jgi:hypothetical protein
MVAPVPPGQRRAQPAPQEAMRMRLQPHAPSPVRPGIGPQPPVTQAPTVTPEQMLAGMTPPPWSIVLTSPSDGKPLLTMREEHGMLVVEGDESRWADSARRFVGMMLQWAGQAGIHWKDDARKATEQ